MSGVNKGQVSRICRVCQVCQLWKKPTQFDLNASICIECNDARRNVFFTQQKTFDYRTGRYVDDGGYI